MKRKTAPLPELPLDVLKQVQAIEDFAHKGLVGCSGPILGEAFNLEKATRLLRTCVVEVFEIQVRYYGSLTGCCPEWIDEIARNTVAINVGTLSDLNPLVPYDTGALIRKLRQTLQERVSNYKAKLSQAGIQRVKAGRLPSVVTSPIAARRMEQYLRDNNVGQTDFATRIGTTDRTLRAFRSSGKVRRDIFDAIAKGMGISKENLLKP